MLRRGLLAVMFIFAAVVASAAPAQAFETGDRLVVIAYFSDHTKTTLVGQQWHGCGQPPGSWGVTSPIRELHLPPC
jgi:hypothetical protein